MYQATDTKLNRQVALKILPEAFASDPDRLARFQREAQVLASLNHPNIAAIYGLEESDGTRALVLELVEGPTLADRVSRGPIPVGEALPIAKQIAEALEAAHESGVIHRDLKPANIKVRPDGTVKVLDFGLAKALAGDTQGGDLTASPTVTASMPGTREGVILGTAAYMSPEQARGKVLDRRTDIWSFGCVMYEVLTGHSPFLGETLSDTVAKILEREPDWQALPAIPTPVATYLRRCLEKDPKERIRDIGDVRLAMSGAFDVATPPPVALPEPPLASAHLWQRPVPVVIVGLLVALTVLAGGWTVMRARPPAPRPLAQFVLQTPPDGALSRFDESLVAISPDGSRVVYTGDGESSQLYVRPLGELDATPLRGTEGGRAPFFSPDGQSVGFLTRDGFSLKQVSVHGGPASTIADPDSIPRGVSWGPDDLIVFGSTGGLMRVPAVGGEPEQLTTVNPEQGETEHRFPHVLPNLKGVLFTAWAGSGENSRLAVVSLETRAVTYLLEGGSTPHYSPTGHIVFGVGGTLQAVGFDAERLELTSSSPVPVVEDVDAASSGTASFALAAGGSLVYVRDPGVEITERSLVWVDREGREEPLSMPPRPYMAPSVSPDGLRVAVDELGLGSGEIWIHDIARGTETLLTTDPGQDISPLWTTDGEWIVYCSIREGQPALFRKRADASGDAEHLLTSRGNVFIQPTSWANEGRTLLFFEVLGAEGDIGLISMEGDRASDLLLETEFFEQQPVVSPDGGWIAYESDETGRREVYVQRFPTLGGKQSISTGGGRQPSWSSDGLFYRSPSGMMRVPVETEPTLTLGSPEVLFEDSYYRVGSARTYDLAPDGRFLMVKEAAAAAQADGRLEIVLMQNWFEELERLVPRE